MDDAPERLSTRVEKGPARMVLEARELVSPARVQLAVEQHVTDHPHVTGNRLVREEPDSRQERAVPCPVPAAEELVAAADGEQRHAARMRVVHSSALRSEIRSDETLLPVLTASDVEEVVAPTGRAHRRCRPPAPRAGARGVRRGG